MTVQNIWRKKFTTDGQQYENLLESGLREVAQGFIENVENKLYGNNKLNKLYSDQLKHLSNIFYELERKGETIANQEKLRTVIENLDTSAKIIRNETIDPKGIYSFISTALDYCGPLLTAEQDRENRDELMRNQTYTPITKTITMVYEELDLNKHN
ncbi:MAG: hypothetical protein ACQESE_02700 [Nanobdellota archaeon]